MFGQLLEGEVVLRSDEKDVLGYSKHTGCVWQRKRRISRISRCFLGGVTGHSSQEILHPFGRIFEGSIQNFRRILQRRHSLRLFAVERWHLFEMPLKDLVTSHLSVSTESDGDITQVKFADVILP